MKCGSIALIALMSFGLACSKNKKGEMARHDDTQTPAAKEAVMASNPDKKPDAKATIKPAKSAATQPVNKNVTGTVTFTTLEDGKVNVVADVSGFEPNTKHGFHIHEKGDLSKPDLSSAGGHFDPAKTHRHGAPMGGAVHAGDLGNLEANTSGMAHLEITLDDISVGTGKPNDVIGKSVIVHAGVDDLTSQPSGNSGGRVAGGVIK